MVHALQTVQNLVISHCCFAEDSQEMYQELSGTGKAIVFLVKTFVYRCCIAVVVFLSSLMQN